MLSMTGFAQSQMELEDYTLQMEVKSLNNKYLELRFHFPYGFERLEYELRKRAKEYVSRGKIDVYLKITAQKSRELMMLKDIFLHYHEIIRQIEDETGVKISYNISDIIALKSYLNPFEQNEALRDISDESIIEIFNRSMKMLVEERKREGEATKKSIEECLREIDESLFAIEQRFPAIVDNYKEQLKQRVEELVSNGVDETRIMIEVGIYANKIDINEEIIRIKEHLRKLKTTINLNQPVGRNLDFILQEINREINTIGAKVPDYLISEKVVSIKSSLEKIKEQVRNIE